MKKIKFTKKIDMSILKKKVDRKKNIEHYKKICQKTILHKHKKINCPICNFTNTKKKVFLEVYKYKYIQCSKCDHVYLDKIPLFNSEDIKLSEYMSKELYEKQVSRNYRIKKVAKPKVDFVIDSFKKNYRGKWIDLACGTGETLNLIREKKWEVLGIDNNRSSISYAKRNYNIDILYKNLNDLNSKDISNYDVISVFLLFEHLESPFNLLKKIKNGMKKNALLVIEINLADSLSSYIQNIFRDKIDRHLLPCSHLNMFTYNSLSFCLNKLNFKIIKEWWFGQDAYELFQMLNLSINKNNLSKEQHEMINNFQKIIDRSKNSDRLICIIKKK